MGKTIRGSSTVTWMGKSTELGMSMLSSKTMITLVGIRGSHKNGWKKAAYGSHVEEMNESGRSRRANLTS